ncbi:MULTISPECIES: flavodoxin domain-containing protein [Paenibacillus]|jgi:menaquinone-dependent protoporphyrinogen oxidase|uniref:flavodoxin domain-containing protein n=1 Tax=Paenibacillus TaxID=44249 RepID=UPI0004F5CEB2|nr:MULTISPECIES: flavodoxin domain-containing protein [unclassified Paenibacillus]AIQ30658.1 flavodoxin [Paenibacillus sp. FSL P4-0081]OMF30229.1 flavodoxin [Paenibacillus sp. FSL H8-0259]
MALLILYATKSGASEQCAFLLAEYIPGSTLCNLESEKPDIENYDHIILGAGVRDGKLYKPVRDFIKKNKPALLDKQMGYYICNEKPKKTEEIITDNIPEDLRQASLCIESFGGYKAYAAPAKDADQLKGIFVERIRTFSEHFK